MAKKSKAELQKELAAGKSIADVAAAEQDTSNDNPIKEQLNADLAPGNPAPSVLEEPAAPVTAIPKAPGKIQQILDLFKAGKTNKEIAALPVLDGEGKPTVIGKDEKGEDIFETFHPTTISIQVSKYKKANPDLFPVLPPAPTKKQLAAEAKAKKEAEKQAVIVDSKAEAPAANAVAEEATVQA